ncbi:polysaccharide deacetylase domain-containing protein [Hirsutella rhossiliensis]|uniref:Polysaccharide deacetylase domain-containing protein n=1 Tax=Hirsutella rhossiliensis TaxID=111463 RepID=A0A9P8SK89_9HYPO|nr:polysaccharide deacetylase domain-containing protein [Hirsutella rhossiliensis]KAH0966093.1 polysaccharide deacetylase domain-containing protein [Hirsutella rhossiliensis]
MRLGLAQRLTYVSLLSSVSTVVVGIQPPVPLQDGETPPDPYNRCGLDSVSPGRCPPHKCCSEAGYCGDSKDYCKGSQCQLEYSDSCDTFFAPKGADTDRIPRPLIGNVPYGAIIDQCRPGTMALTYDDGPGEYTSQLLDLLDELKVKATFFITGNGNGKGHIDEESSGYPQVLRRMHGAGHQLGSHTWTHRSLDALLMFERHENRDLGPAVRRTEVMFNEMAFRNILGFFPTYFRPPYLDCGSSCRAFLEEYGYHIISANSDTKDYENDDPALIANSRARFSDAVGRDANAQGYIVLAHDVHYQSVANLTAYMVNEARNRGYELLTVGECLGDPKENWYRKA